MAYSTLSVLRKAGQLLRFQYDVENEVSETGKRLTSYLQQAIDEVLHETDWIFAIKVLELAPDGNSTNTQYGFKYTYKLPNDCVRDIGLYAYYLGKGESGPFVAPPVNSFIVGFPRGFGWKTWPLKFKRINNTILADVNKLLLEYVSNDDKMLASVNEIWFVNLIAHKLAVICGATMLNTNDYQQLKQEYSTMILPSAVNKNCNLKDKVYNYSDSGIYPYSQGGNYY
jgi:hypothetical protein